MADTPGMKSAYELAMERLRKKDQEAGIEHRPLTDAQRAAIADARNFYDSKLAEQDVLHQSAVRRTDDPTALAALDEAYRRDRDRLVADREAKVEKLRRG